MDTIKFSIDIPVDLYQKIKMFCDELGMTIEDFILESVSKRIEKAEEDGTLEQARIEYEKKRKI